MSDGPTCCNLMCYTEKLQNDKYRYLWEELYLRLHNLETVVNVTLIWSMMKQIEKENR